MTRKMLVIAAFAAVLAFAAVSGFAGGKREAGGAAAHPGVVTVDVIYLNHPPLIPVLAEVDKALQPYGDKVKVVKYDFDTSEGEAFAKQKHLVGHIPLVIFVNGSSTVTVAGTKVTFESFPKGEGPGMIPDGDWSVADLDAAVKGALAP